MNSMRLFLATVLALVVFQSSIAVGAVRGDDVKYIGGTLTNIPEETEGHLDVTNEKSLKFTCKKGSIEIPYESITSLEFGQKAGRRLGVALVAGPLALLSKKRRHFLTIGYKDDNDKGQGVVLELAKDLPRTVITVLESRSGVKCDYESEEARKHVHG